MSERDSICASEEKLGRRPHNYRHGESKTKLHGVWTSMCSLHGEAASIAIQARYRMGSGIGDHDPRGAWC
jgi:hypothetical protein